MTGVLMGLVIATLIGIWRTRDLWLGRALPFDWRLLLAQVVPLMLGFAAFQFLVGPLATVMFPRIVHSAAKSEKSNLMGIVLLGTAVLAILGVASLTLVGPFVVKLVYKPSYVEVATKVLPWYAGAMVPLALANVLLNNLLARSMFKVVPPLCILALG